MTAPVGTRQRPVENVGTNGVRAMPSPARSRNVPWVVLGVILVAGSALAFALYAQSLEGRHPALAVAKPVAAGQRIQSSDLKVVGIAADAGLKPMAASAKDKVVGQVAVVDLVPGTLLTKAQVGSASGLAAGQAVVSMSLKAGQVDEKLEVGDRVMVIDTGNRPGAIDEAQPAVLIPAARVSAVRLPAEDDPVKAIIVSIVVPADQAARIAATVSAGRIALASVAA